MTLKTPPTPSTILVTGATGFVGSHLVPALSAAGHGVRGLTRGVTEARRRWPEREFVGGDLADEAALGRALEGCDAAYYLVHGMAEGDPDYRRHEVEQARGFAIAAERAGLQRIVYLGGVAPAGPPSEHLRSRLEVGSTLRAGRVPTVELRASMIVGQGSSSWLIVRDLAARLPFMVLPRWLSSRTQPVALADVIVALVRALDVPIGQPGDAGHADPGGEDGPGAWFDIPGPAILSGQEILEATAEVMGIGKPIMIRVPFLSPRLSSHWVRLVARAPWSVARELVLGLSDDLLAVDDRYWQLIDHRTRVDFREAARRALAAERREPPIAGAWGAIERMLARRHRPQPA